jgi:tRNA G18 (ribose-2'-O)-methylase SpoU
LHALCSVRSGGLILDGVSDAGNCGAILRSAAAFGYNQVILLDGCVDLFAPKVLNSSAGAVSALRAWKVGMSSIELLSVVQQTPELAGRLFALVPSGGVAPLSLPLRPYWLVIGNEAHGISDAVLSLCSDRAGAVANPAAPAPPTEPQTVEPLMQRLTVPMSPVSESLNAAVSASLCMFALSPYREKKP